MGVTDILYILFKHKRKILLSAFAGSAAAAAYYFLFPSPYESQAKLLVRYVLDRNAVDSAESQVKTPEAISINDNLITSETEILTSWDLAEQIAGSVSPERLAPGVMGKAVNIEAAKNVIKDLKVTATKGSNVILISYRNTDPELAVRVLQELVTRYFVKHLEVHRSASAFEYVSNETDQVRARLDKIDKDLKSLKDRAGIISLTESTASLNAAMDKSEEALNAAEAEAAEQRARVAAIEQGLHASGVSDMNSVVPPPADKDAVRQYQFLLGQIARMQQANLDLLTRFTPQSEVMKVNEAQVENLRHQKLALEQKYPGLIGMTPITSPKGVQTDLNSEKAQLAALEGKVEMLKSQFQGFKEQNALLAEIGPQIAQLEQKKEVEEANYKYFQGSLEKARIDEALDPSKMPNISVVQKPSPALRPIGERRKFIIGLAGVGLMFGLALAFLIELGVDRTVRRPIELENMHIPRMLSIPDVRRNGYARLHSTNGDKHLSAPLAKTPLKRNGSWEDGHFIRPFCESLRDRLILYFHLNNMTRKPKLVAVTGCSEGVGASTLAGGLAASLSETGDGKVLLVDMNVGHEEIHPFIEGRHVSSLADAIQSGSNITATSDNLYLATATSENSMQVQLIPKRFYDLVPRLKTSDYDYIIFDMPPLDQTSTTLAMAGFMDKVLLVVEAEVSKRDAVRRGYAELIAAKANVSTVFNKSRSYGPKWLHDET